MVIILLFNNQLFLSNQFIFHFSFFIMSFPVFNSVQDPTSTLLIKWSSKRKAGIIDEKSLEAALPTEYCKIIAFAAKY